MPISKGRLMGRVVRSKKARTRSPIGPSRRMTGPVSVKVNTVLGMPPGAVPPSKIRGTKPSNWARTPGRWPCPVRRCGWRWTRPRVRLPGPMPAAQDGPVPARPQSPSPRGEAGGQVGQPRQHQGEGTGPEALHQAPGQSRHLRHHLIQLIFPGQRGWAGPSGGRPLAS